MILSKINNGIWRQDRKDQSLTIKFRGKPALLKLQTTGEIDGGLFPWNSVLGRVESRDIPAFMRPITLR